MKRSNLLLLLSAVFLIMAQLLTAQATQGYSVKISSNAKGASLYVDGKYAGIVPGEFRMSFGKHTLKLTAPGYLDMEKIINVNAKLTMNINLQQAASNPTTATTVDEEYKVVITSNVDNADIYIDGVLRGQTPAVFRLKAGNYNIKLTAKGFTDAVQQISVTKESSYTITLQAAVVNYTLEVTANVNNARVFINCKDSGEVPVTLSLQEGNYSVKVVKQDYSDYEQTVKLDKATKIKAILEPIMASVKIIIPQNMYNGNSAHDFLKRIDVLLDGKKLNSLEFAVTRGQHKIQIVSGGIILETNIDFSAGKTYELKPALNVDIR